MDAGVKYLFVHIYITPLCKKLRFTYFFHTLIYL